MGPSDPIHVSTVCLMNGKYYILKIERLKPTDQGMYACMRRSSCCVMCHMGEFVALRDLISLVTGKILIWFLKWKIQVSVYSFKLNQLD